MRLRLSIRKGGESKMRMRNRNGQSTAEYAIVLSIVIAAVIGMQVYVKRGLQAKVKGAMDHFATGVTGNAGGAPGGGIGTVAQYEPYYANTNYTINENSSSVDTYRNGGLFGKNQINESTFRNGNTGTSTGGFNYNRGWK